MRHTRNPERIKPILNELESIWNKVPDWRFGQLMSNLLGDIAATHKISDIFFPEDSFWLTALKEFNEKLK